MNRHSVHRLSYFRLPFLRSPFTFQSTFHSSTNSSVPVPPFTVCRLPFTVLPFTVYRLPFTINHQPLQSPKKASPKSPPHSQFRALPDIWIVPDNDLQPEQFRVGIPLFAY